MKNLTTQTSAGLMTLALGIGLSSLGIQSIQAQEAVEKIEAPATPKLNIGDAIPGDALAGVTWVQGDEVKSLDEKGKVYILECWATWCAPCIEAIPHVNQMHKKFESKGLVIVGMNVWEDGLEKTQEFVKKKGDGMSYRVAYSGGHSSGFVDKILKPAGVKGIPRAMVVKDGKLVLSIDPAQIDDALVNSILSGDFDPVAFAKKQATDEAAEKALSLKIHTLKQAGDWTEIKKLADNLEDGNAIKFGLLLRVAANASDWKELLAIRNDILGGEKYAKPISVSIVDSAVARESPITEGAKTYSDISLANYKELEAKAKPIDAVEHHYTKARLHFMSGQVEEAKKGLAAAESLLEKIDNPHAKQFFSSIVKGANKKVKDGSFPVYTELIKK